MNHFREKIGGSTEETETNAVIERAHEKAVMLLGKEAIDINEFKGIYGEAVIKEDIMKVADYERKFSADATPQDKQNKKLATVIEALFYDQARNNGWLGPDAQVLRSSNYDDYVNGVDCITEYKSRGEAAYLAMAIDATWSAHPGWKFNKIRNELIKGRLGKIKYLKADGKPKASKQEVPRVVVGASPKTLMEVIKLWTDGNEEALKDHPVQILFLEEIVSQLEGFRTFSAAKGHDKNVETFDRYLAILKPILEQKRTAIPDRETFKSDAVWSSIKGELVGLNYQRPVAA